MSQGFVPVSYPVGIAPEIIKNGQNGFIIKNLEEAEEKIQQLLNDRDLRHRLALNAIISTQQFKPNVIIIKMLSLYRKILGSKQNS
jgi:glycosyltransferase involved in cell wall biosynthesis